MLSKRLAAAGKTTLIVVSAGFGLLRSLRLLGDLAGHARTLQNFEARLDTLNVAVARLAGQTEKAEARLEQTASQMVTQMVTKDELHLTLERVFGRVEEEVEARFEHQARSVEALRTMVGHTDELLERVLEGLESLKEESAELHGSSR